MALSLPGERSLAAATPAYPFAAFVRWISNAQAARTRRVALEDMLQLDGSRLADMGVSHSDIVEALARKDGRPEYVLNAARSRNARR